MCQTSYFALCRKASIAVLVEATLPAPLATTACPCSEQMQLSSSLSLCTTATCAFLFLLFPPPPSFPTVSWLSCTLCRARLLHSLTYIQRHTHTSKCTCVCLFELEEHDVYKAREGESCVNTTCSYQEVAALQQC